MMGMKGEPGIVGAQGKKGDKGEKGESIKASPASAVPQTNWKQCVWKKGDGTDNGKIKVMERQSLNDSFILGLRKESSSFLCASKCAAKKTTLYRRENYLIWK